MNKYLTLLCLLFLFACQNSSHHERAEQTSAEYYEQEAPTEDKQILAERKIIKEGHLTFQTTSINETRQSILDVASKQQAYIANDRSYTSGNRLNNVLVLRVPAPKFETLLNEISKGVAQFDSKQVSADDVTEQYIDMEARIKTKKELEQRYLELLAKAQNVQEMLEIEKQIGELRSDIEVIEGRFKAMQNKVSYSTLHITFYEKIDDSTNFSGEFGRAFSNGLDNLIYFLLLLTNLWAFFLLGLLIFCLIWFLRKRRKNKKETKK
ncbi:MAG: DUF4349 domain-containing protein [Bernardetiaceae bacterium]|nr:DUF4349 domain-containing protein [Bernardetiaceae bacterium]